MMMYLFKPAGLYTVLVGVPLVSLFGQVKQRRNLVSWSQRVIKGNSSSRHL